MVSVSMRLLDCSGRIGVLEADSLGRKVGVFLLLMLSRSQFGQQQAMELLKVLLV